MRLRLLGDLVLEADGHFPHFKALLMLAYICLEPKSKGHVRRQLGELFWSDRPFERQRANVSQALYQLRAALPEALIVIDNQEFVAKGELSSDVQDFFQAYTQGNTLVAEQLYKGPFLDGIESHKHYPHHRELEEWIQLKRDQIAYDIWEVWLYKAAQLPARDALDVIKRSLTIHGGLPVEQRQLLAIFGLLDNIQWDKTQTIQHDIVEELGEIPHLESMEALGYYQTSSDKGDSASGIGFPVPLLPAHALSCDLNNVISHFRSAGRPELLENTAKKALCHNTARFAGLCIGREQELSDLAELLYRRPLVTLSGLGGIGKSWLAWHVCQSVATQDTADVPSFFQEAFFVACEQVDADAFPALIQQLIQRLETLVARPVLPSEDHVALPMSLATTQDKVGYPHTLIVLDHMDHLIKGGGHLAQLMPQLPNVRWLITSRQRLGFLCEQLYPLAGLKLPEAHVAKPYAASMELFVQRRRQLEPHFTLSPDEAHALSVLCHFSEGHPLTLELAASMRHLLPSQLLQTYKTLELSGSYHDLPRRHRSLQALLQEIWETLTPQEQDGLRTLADSRLAPSPSAMNGQAIQPQPPALRLPLSNTLILSLLDKSVIRLDQGYYDVHPLLKHFVAQKVAQPLLAA